MPKATSRELETANSIMFQLKRQLCIAKTCDNSDIGNYQNIYESMVHTSDNDEIPSRYFGDSSQLTNWILY